MKISVDIDVPEGKLCKDGEKFCCEHLIEYFCPIFRLGVWKSGRKGEFVDEEMIYKSNKCFSKGDD